MPGVQITLSVLTLVVASVTAVLVWRANTGATTQRENQGRREEWWRRFQWAAGMAVDEDERKRRVGVVVIGSVIESPLAGADELRAARAVMDEVERNHDNGTQEVGNDDSTEA
jgi:hypothetical protein